MSKDGLDEASGIKDLVRQHWGRRAAAFDQGASHGLLSQGQHDAWRDLLLDVFGPKPLDVADLGCGTGFLALLMAELGHRPTGIDFADEMLTEARRKAEAAGYVVAFHQGDAEAPVLPPASFEVLLERHVIWTLPQPERALGAWLSILRPGGADLPDRRRLGYDHQRRIRSDPRPPSSLWRKPERSACGNGSRHGFC
jgi:ubiquinone/menaquinone biosynthesis C-methylase UbiE